MCFHVVSEVEAVAVGVPQSREWFSPFVLEDADVFDAVDAVVGKDIVIIVVADEVVLPALGDHLIRVDYIILRLAVFAELGMVLLVRAVVDVMERHLTFV